MTIMAISVSNIYISTLFFYRGKNKKLFIVIRKYGMGGVCNQSKGKWNLLISCIGIYNNLSKNPPIT